MKNIYSLDMKTSSIKSNNTSSFSEYLSTNRNICTTYKTLKDIVHLVKITTIHPSTAPKSSVELKRIFGDKIYPPPGSNHQVNSFNDQLETASTLHQYPTIKNFFFLEKSIYQLTVEQICTKIYTLKLKFTVRFAVTVRLKIHRLYKTMFIQIHEKFRAFLDYVHMTTYNQIN